ncbi:hypothetical protein MUK42_36982 [Musa troglodytarum]|uniref:Uncharacterized protein n=1 Tax=Musa troglodytarum TaxID=320322 RepID=A0A9E7HRV8_9LILI|nr:hypothetical protein MUK42_36982 [Musa troglodytarum]
MEGSPQAKIIEWWRGKGLEALPVLKRQHKPWTEGKQQGPRAETPPPSSPAAPGPFPRLMVTLFHMICAQKWEEQGEGGGAGAAHGGTCTPPLLPHSHHQRSVSPPMCSMERAKTPRPPLMPPHESNQMPFAQSKSPQSPPSKLSHLTESGEMDLPPLARCIWR